MHIAKIIAVIVIGGLVVGILSWVFGPEKEEQPKTNTSEIQMVDASTFLFPVPTICDRMAPLKEDAVCPAEGAFSFHEDDWRQMEFVAVQDKAHTKQEIEAIERFKDENRDGMGYKSVYIRKDHPTHLSKLNIKLSSIEESLGVSHSNRKPFFIFPSFSAEKHNEVVGGFAYLVSDGVWLYGFEKEGIVGGLGLYFDGQAELDQNTYNMLMEMARRNGLILVNWFAPEFRDPSGDFEIPGARTDIGKMEKNV